MAPLLPFLAEQFHQVLVAPAQAGAPESVHLTSWPEADLAALRDRPLEAAMADLRRAVELGRTLRGRAGVRVRQPLGRLWLAMPGGGLGAGLSAGAADELQALLADELNVKAVEIIGDESELVDRRVKPLLPVIGRRYREAIPAIMAAARDNAVTYHDDGSVELGGRAPPARRGRDPGHAAPRHRRRPRRGHRRGHRHRADARSCEPRATPGS